MDSKPWDAEYSRLVSKASGPDASFDGQRSFLAFCRLRAVGAPEHIAAAGASLLSAAGAALRLGYEYEDVLEQTAVAEMHIGKGDAAAPRVEALRQRHPTSQRAGRLQAQLLEARGDRSGASSALKTVLDSNAGHSGALRRRVALAKKRLVLPAGAPTSAAHLALAGRPGGEAALTEAVKELASLLELSGGDPDAWVEMAELQVRRSLSTALCQSCNCAVPQLTSFSRAALTCNCLALPMRFSRSLSFFLLRCGRPSRLHSLMLHLEFKSYTLSLPFSPRCASTFLFLQLALRRPEQAAFAYEEAILAAPNHPEFHVRAAEIALHRALRCPCPSGGSSGSRGASSESSAAGAAGAAGAASAAALRAAATALATSDASSGAVTMSAATAGVGADAASAGALLRQARLHAAEAVRQTENAGTGVDADASAAAAAAVDAPYANGYALAVLADVCWAHITRVVSALASSSSSSSSSAAVFAHPPARLFSVSSSESATPTLAATVAIAADDLRPSSAAASAAASAADAAAAAARSGAKDAADLLLAAAAADPEVNGSILLHRLAAHGLERLAAAGGGAAAAADVASAAAAATGPLPFTAVEFATVRGPYARFVIARDALLSAAGVKSA